MARAEVVRLRRSSLTLEDPQLKDLRDALAGENPPRNLHLGFHRLGGRVTGLPLSLVPGTLSHVDKVLLLDHRCDGLTIRDGTIALDHGYSLLITGVGITFNNVTIVGAGKQWQRRIDACLVRVADGGHAIFEDCIIECESQHEAHALLADKRGVIEVVSSRVYGPPAGHALKVSGASALVRKRSLLQGGVLITAPSAAAAAAATPRQPQTDTLTRPQQKSTQAAEDQPIPDQASAQEQQQPEEGAGAGTDPPVAGEEGQSAGQEGPLADSQHPVEDQGAGLPAEPHIGGSTGGDLYEGRQQQQQQDLDPQEGGMAGTQEEEQQDGGAELDGQQQQHQQQEGMEVDTEVAEEDSRASSSVEFKASELRSGLVSVLTAFGSHTSVSLDSCHVDGSTNYGILASKGARIEATGTEVTGATVAAVVVTGGASLTAERSVLVGELLGLLVERGSQAALSLCTLSSERAEQQQVALLPLPPAPKPGFLPSFAPAVPAAAEVRGQSSIVRSTNCKLGRGQGGLQPRAVKGGAWVVQDGVA